MLDEIRDIDLSHLLLTAQMLREDRVSAMLNLGINHDLAEILEKLTTAQLMNMASTNMLLCRFRFDDYFIAELLSIDTGEQVVSKNPNKDLVGLAERIYDPLEAPIENGGNIVTKQ